MVPIAESSVTAHLTRRPVTIRRIARFLYGHYARFVDTLDAATKGESEQFECLLTRSLAAHAVAVYAKLEPEAAAKCVTDGGQDLGIDAIAFNEIDKRCWLFQADFQQSGRGRMSWSKMSRFLDGFDAITSEQLEGANPKILAFESEIRRAVTEPGWKFILVLASTSVGPLSDSEAERVHERLAYQDPGNSGTFTFEQFPLNAVTRSIEQAFDAAKISLTVELYNWGCVSDPFIAYYGQVPLDAITKWRVHGQPLFAKNLRGFVQSSQVAESITRTLDTQSELFWYLNNGATVLCERIERLFQKG